MSDAATVHDKPRSEDAQHVLAREPEEHLQVGPVTQYITSLVKRHDELPEPHHGLEHASG